MTENQKFFGPNKMSMRVMFLKLKKIEKTYGTGDAFANGKQSIRWEVHLILEVGLVELLIQNTVYMDTTSTLLEHHHGK